MILKNLILIDFGWSTIGGVLSTDFSISHDKFRQNFEKNVLHIFQKLSEIWILSGYVRNLDIQNLAIRDF